MIINLGQNTKNTFLGVILHFSPREPLYGVLWASAKTELSCAVHTPQYLAVHQHAHANT